MSMVLISREEVFAWLKREWGDHPQTQREIEDFLTAYMGQERFISWEDWLDVSFALFREGCEILRQEVGEPAEE